MSEYRWYVSRCWIGVVDRESDRLLGVIRRSGWCNALGHFCFVDVKVNGKKYAASGAEDRIYPFHSIKLDKGDKVPELELIAVGWCRDHNTYAFRDNIKGSPTFGQVVKIVRAGKEAHPVEAIPEDNWPEIKEKVA